MSANVVNFVKKDEKETIIRIRVTFSDNTTETFPADSIGESMDITGFLALWNENPYELVTFLNKDSIKGFSVIEEEK